jgi:hypothetical protein
MSDREFDNYLALLSRLLRLGDKQRDAIAGELRAHLEERLDDLVARGVPRDEAVRQALEEFGDAASLAAEFVSLSGNRRKRWIMRLTTVSVAAAVLIAAGIVTFWPGNNAGPGRAQVAAQNPAGPGPATNIEAAPLAAPRRALDDKLNQPIDSEFVNTPLKDALQFLQDKAGIQFVVKAKKLEEAGVTVDMPVTMSLKNVKLRTLLELILEQLELTYVTKDDLILITTPEEAESPDNMVVRVYDCRELLALPRPPGSIRPKTADGGRPAAPAEGSVGLEGKGAKQLETSDAENLIDVIETAVAPESWVNVGGPGAIAEYKGLLSVSATQNVHEKVERLLNMFHEAARLQEPRVKVVE